MKALVWLHLVRRDVDKLDIMNETSTIISWNVDYLESEDVLHSSITESEDVPQ